MESPAQHHKEPSPGPTGDPEAIVLRPATWEDVPAITMIHNQGIEDRIATLDTEPHTLEEQSDWFRSHGRTEPVIVAEYRGQVVGWAALSRFSPRRVHDGVKELSIYAERQWRDKGVGTMLLGRLIEMAREISLYKIILNAFPFNEGGIALYRKFGFRTVGLWKNQGMVDGRWVDVVLMEKHLGVTTLDRDRAESSPSRSGQGVSRSVLSTRQVIVVKIGGSTLGQHDTTLEDLVALQRQGTIPVVIHGGGKIITEWMERQGIRPRFVKGLRVTDTPSLDVVVAVLTGLINKSLVASLLAMGARAVGISGVDGAMLQGEIMDPDLGLVGRVVRVNPQPIQQIVDSASIPVIAPVAVHRGDGSPAGGGLLNVNADTAAGEIAATLGAERLVFLTDVEGILDSSHRLIPRLTRQQASMLTTSGIVAGGMVPKVEACLRALNSVPVAQIVDGRRPGALLEALEGKPLGTRIG